MMPLDYVDHFGLRAPPFGQAPSNDFFFAAPQHEQILDDLYHVTHNMLGLAVLTGPVGSGKTTMLRQLQFMLPQDKYQVATWVMHQPCNQPMELLRAISQRLAIRVATDPDAALWNLQRHAQSLHHQGRRLVIFIDEAQMLEDAEAMEALRAMLNWEVDGYKLVTLVLAGLEQLTQNMSTDPSLVARIACQGKLEPFTPPESAAYVRHRLEKAGATQAPFNDPILSRVHALAGGIPRLINTLCDNMLVRLARSNQVKASMDLLDEVAKRFHLTRASPSPATIQEPPPPATIQELPPPENVDLLAYANDIAARVAGGDPGPADQFTPPAGIPLPPESTLELPGDAWLGLQAAGDFLGNNTPPKGIDPRGRAHTDDDVVISILGEAQRRFE